jgi:GTPase SAR1 family protein
MGTSISKGKDSQKKHELDTSKVLDKQNMIDHKKESRYRKLLLLGAGESGKSTLFKQIITLYGEGLSNDQRSEYKYAVHLHVLESIRTLVLQSGLLSSHYHDTSVDSDDAKKASDFVKRRLADAPVSQDLVDERFAKRIKILWKDPGIQRTFELRNKFQLIDSCGYFFENIDRIIQPNYEPTYEDVLHCRVRSTGIVESRFEISGEKFLLLDVGGQRNERKKWINWFEGVTAVIFVASISEFDQTLFEDMYSNRLTDALALFNWVCSQPCFEKTAIILYLNKSDLFAKKISQPIPEDEHSPGGYMGIFCKDYTGGSDFEKATSYLMEKFLDQVPDESRRMSINIHVTCAMDKDNVFKVFNDVKEFVINQAVRKAGLL